MEQRKSCVVTEPVSRILSFTIPRVQRNVDHDHIKAMVEDQKAEYDKYRCFSMLQSITVASLGREIFVLDGQHRIYVFSELGRLGYPVNDVLLPVVVYNIRDREELLEYYNRINHHKPIHPLELQSSWESCGKVFCDLIMINFGAYIKLGGEGKGCRCPHISMHDLKTHFMGRNMEVKLMEIGCSVLDIWAKVLEINSFIASKAAARDQLCPKTTKRLQECSTKAAKNGCKECFLGMWRRFEWLDIALHLLETRQHIHDCASIVADFSFEGTTRARVPAVLRQQVWKKHNANLCDEGECFVCKKELHFVDMECGHIVANALGGKETLDNLMPICKTCNRDMGIMNLYTYSDMVHSTTNMSVP